MTGHDVNVSEPLVADSRTRYLSSLGRPRILGLPFRRAKSIRGKSWRPLRDFKARLYSPIIAESRHGYIQRQ